jgi:Protein of unknown function (DUF3301)
MELSWTALALLIVASAIAWFWQDSLAARERANTAAMEACERLSLQFLDGTVAFATLKVIRGATRIFDLRRTYVFDYTANSIERRQGFIVMTGRRIDSVGFARGEDLQRATPVAPERPIDVQQLPSATNVLSIEEWRARQCSATESPTEPRHNGTNAAD